MSGKMAAAVKQDMDSTFFACNRESGRFIVVFGPTRGLINRAPEIVRSSGEPLTRRPGRPLREGINEN